ncbi:hypothetical protein [Paractinoplanes lichenicola]|uniref:Uncharacterized protein n=1 Tax=Paractinoplanes lichenicola TaxID=2802976 RepID=A0ABS1VDB6_9ACTN|nr:hypothetical protein [Actinoplanes lichenicola]MBL7252700.1 hypothetical protein [Actinoplanes lichenicola]
MTGLSAAQELLLHLALALASLGVIGVARWRIRRGANRDHTARPVEVAYLKGGHRLVVYTGLTALLRHRLVRAGGRGPACAAGLDALGGAAEPAAVVGGAGLGRLRLVPGRGAAHGRPGLRGGGTGAGRDRAVPGRAHPPVQQK